MWFSFSEQGKDCTFCWGQALPKAAKVGGTLCLPQITSAFPTTKHLMERFRPISGPVWAWSLFPLTCRMSWSSIHLYDEAPPFPYKSPTSCPGDAHMVQRARGSAEQDSQLRSSSRHKPSVCIGPMIISSSPLPTYSPGLSSPPLPRLTSEPTEHAGTTRAAQKTDMKILTLRFFPHREKAESLQHLSWQNREKKPFFLEQGARPALQKPRDGPHLFLDRMFNH